MTLNEFKTEMDVYDLPQDMIINFDDLNEYYQDEN